MKKIMFNDKFGLTKAVLEGRKTQTRRIVKHHVEMPIINSEDDLHKVASGDTEDMEMSCMFGHCAYRIGEEVAIAQPYNDTWQHTGYMTAFEAKHCPDYNNKMFVKADLMPHRIKITNIRIECLQDISDEDCLKEGVEYSHKGGYYVGYDNKTGSRTWLGKTPKEAFASLIDKVYGKGTWDSNPYVFVYDFELLE